MLLHSQNAVLVVITTPQNFISETVTWESPESHLRSQVSHLLPVWKSPELHFRLKGYINFLYHVDKRRSKQLARSWTSLHKDETDVSFFLDYLAIWGISLGPKLYPRCGFFGTWPSLILKSSYQDLSNKWSNFILSPLKHTGLICSRSFQNYH